MRRTTTKRRLLGAALGLLIGLASAQASAQEASGHDHPAEAPEEAPDAAGQISGTEYHATEGPALPEGMTLDEVLARAAKPPPEDWPEPVPDDALYLFVLGEQLEYRFAGTDQPDELGVELQAWAGTAVNRLWLESEAESAAPQAEDFEGESEHDLSYSRLFTPFWYVQAGAQYANGWTPDNYEDRWSAMVGVQGTAPGMFEVDTAVYLSQDADVTGALEAEYDLRITQRLVLQPLVELGLSAQEVPERGLGVGLTRVTTDMRLRYEILREFAPYVGARFQTLVGETHDMAEAAAQPTSWLMVVGGLRFGLL